MPLFHGIFREKRHRCKIFKDNQDLVKISLVLVLADTVLNNLQGVVLFQDIQPVSQNDHGIQLVLFKERHHVWKPSQDDF